MRALASESTDLYRNFIFSVCRCIFRLSWSFSYVKVIADRTWTVWYWAFNPAARRQYHFRLCAFV